MSLHLITGGAGFVAVTLTRRLLERGHAVLAVDNLSRGRRGNLAEWDGDERVRFVEADCADEEHLLRAIRAEIGDAPLEDVWHLAANSDIPAGVADLRIDLKDTFLSTVGVLQAMRVLGSTTLHFASSSAIYGDFGDALIHEDIGPLEPISNYGAMKLASEAQIRAAVESWLARADVLRFPNVIGAPATHGVILDFVRKLKATPDELEVLGNGAQQKAYLHVDDLVDAMLHVADLDGRYNVYNIGPSDTGVTVRAIAERVRDRVSPRAGIRFGEGDRGWVGDVPRFRYSTERLTRTGWTARLGSEAAVVRAVDAIAEQELSA